MTGAPTRTRRAAGRVRPTTELIRRRRPPLPRNPPRTADVEELRHDHPTVGDHPFGHLPLPRQRRHRILKLHRRRPPVEGEPTASRGRGWRFGDASQSPPPGHPQRTSRSSTPKGHPRHHLIPPSTEAGPGSRSDAPYGGREVADVLLLHRDSVCRNPTTHQPDAANQLCARTSTATACDAGEPATGVPNHARHPGPRPPSEHRRGRADGRVVWDVAGESAPRAANHLTGPAVGRALLDDRFREAGVQWS